MVYGDGELLGLHLVYIDKFSTKLKVQRLVPNLGLFNHTIYRQIWSSATVHNEKKAETELGVWGALRLKTKLLLLYFLQLWLY
jgi:hypothetical protein